MGRPSIKSMSFQAVDKQPVSFNFSQGYGDVEEGGVSWEFVTAEECPVCGKIVAGTIYESGEAHSDLDHNSDCGGMVYGSGPMMSYYYPISETAGSFDQKTAAKKLINLPLCIVEIDDDEIGLALTGGGMDLGWEICEAFLRLGMVPPAHFAGRLPRMSGRGTSARDRWIIAGCRASLRCIVTRATYDLQTLAQNFPPARKAAQG